MQYLHCIVLLLLFLLHQVDFPKGTFANHSQNYEMLWSHFFIIFRVFFWAECGWQQGSFLFRLKHFIYRIVLDILNGDFLYRLQLFEFLFVNLQDFWVGNHFNSLDPLQVLDVLIEFGAAQNLEAFHRVIADCVVSWSISWNVLSIWVGSRLKQCLSWLEIVLLASNHEWGNLLFIGAINNGVVEKELIY